MQQKERRLDELELEELVRVRSRLGEIDTGVEQVVRSETDSIGGGRQRSIGKATRIVARGGGRGFGHRARLDEGGAPPYRVAESPTRVQQRQFTTLGERGEIRLHHHVTRREQPLQMRL